MVVLLASLGCGSSRHGDPPKRVPAKRASDSLPPLTQQSIASPALAGQTIASVGKYRLRRGYLEQWGAFEALVGSQYKRSSSVPAGFIPDPPDYMRCIQYEKTHAVAVMDSEEAKVNCEQRRYENTRSGLTHLLHYVWTHEEAAIRNITVPVKLVAETAAARWSDPRILAALQVPLSIEYYLAETERLTERIFETLPAHLRLSKIGPTKRLAAEIDAENTKFYGEMEKRWTKRTKCEPEFVTYGCGEYGTNASP